MRIRNVLRYVAFAALLSSSGAVAFAQQVQPWPPEDPDEHVTRVPFTVAWAKRLRGFKRLEDLQRAAGAKGRISERSLADKHPRVSFHWRSQPSEGSRGGWMLAGVYADGGIGVQIITNDGIDLTINNFGAFICDRCSPPVEVLGATPSWAR